MANRQVWNDSLDEMLEKLNNGNFVDQSISEFEKTINKTASSSTTSTKKTTTNTSSKTTSGSDNKYTRTTYKTAVPHINRTIEAQSYASRYLQVITCLENIVYDHYPDSKQEGYRACINRYIELVQANSNNLKPIESEVDADLKEYKEKTKGAIVDGFLQGYYDALLMVKKCLYSSKLARLQVLSNRVSKL